MSITKSHQSAPDQVVLHTLRCIGTASADRVASACGLPPDEVAQRLGALSDRGLVTLFPGPFGGWELTDLGRTTVQESVAAELAIADARDDVHGLYESFLTLNSVLLEVCSDWQMWKVGSTRVLNDHSDRNHDAGVLSRLIRIDEAAQQICGDLAGCLQRFSVYSSRLSFALERAVAGDDAYVADNLDSYHTVWFQLHEDLLVTLGISRDDERQGKPGSG